MKILTKEAKKEIEAVLESERPLIEDYCAQHSLTIEDAETLLQLRRLDHMHLGDYIHAGAEEIVQLMDKGNDVRGVMGVIMRQNPGKFERTLKLADDEKYRQKIFEIYRTGIANIYSN